jgi:hypothetical protein
LFAPLGTPEPIIKRLNDALVKALSTPEARKQFEDIGIETVVSNPSDLAAELKQQADFWGPPHRARRSEAGLIARRPSIYRGARRRRHPSGQETDHDDRRFPGAYLGRGHA